MKCKLFNSIQSFKIKVNEKQQINLMILKRLFKSGFRQNRDEKQNSFIVYKMFLKYSVFKLSRNYVQPRKLVVLDNPFHL